MANNVIIADAGPLIAFGRIKQLPLLTKTLGTIIAPAFVLSECLANIAQAGAKEIADAIDQALIQVHDNPDNNHHKSLFDILGAGEASAIILATHLKAGILIDDKLGRKTALKMNLSIIGTAGVLLLAKKKGLIKSIAPLIFELKKSGYYYLSEELIKTMLSKAQEK